MMAQDLFTAFMFEAASIISPLTGVTIRQRQSSSVDTPSLVSNVHIDALAGMLHNSGLATEEDALMSVIPAFYHQSKLPSLDNVVPRMIDEISKLKRSGQYEEGEMILKRMLRSGKQCHHAQVARALGELYRSALRSLTRPDFAFRGMTSLRDIASMTTESGSQLSDAAISILETGFKLPELNLSVVDRLWQDAKQQGQSTCRAHALYLSERFNLSIRSSSAIQKLLFISIEFGYVEVIEEIRQRNPLLVMEPAEDIVVEMVERQRSIRLQALGTDEAKGILRPFLFAVDGNGNTPLMFAVDLGCFPAVNMLLEGGSNIQAVNNNGETALSKASSNGYLDIAARILEEGQRHGFQFTTPYLRDALTTSLRLNRRDLIKPILLSHSKPEEHHEPGSMLPLSHGIRVSKRFCTQRGHGTSVDPELIEIIINDNQPVPEDVIAILLKAAIEHTNPYWIQQLHARQPEDVLRWFEDSGMLKPMLHLTDLNAGGEEDASHTSDRRRNVDLIIRTLLDIEAAVTVGDLHCALRLRPADDIFAALLDRGKSMLNSPWLDHGTLIQTLLDSAVWDGTAAQQEQYLSRLLEAGCDPNKYSFKWAATPLQIASISFPRSFFAVMPIRILFLPHATVGMRISAG
ncbi:hypothetical protein VTJ04DRAFT_9331 [Mycothermus thermophilus]|uniref:uncharacterized protein n=1 Tax=Humicola insolens TaxID=85995 RepID=UPI0037436203